MVAPFVPFVAEAVWRNLAGVFGERAVESVHLCDYPRADAAVIDEELSERMAIGREIASLGRSARMDAKLKVRQPLAKVEVILADNKHLVWLEQFRALVCEELNVKEVEFTTAAEHYISYVVQPNFKRLGPRVGRLMPAVKKMLLGADGSQLLRELRDHGKITLAVGDETVVLDEEDVEIRIKAKEGWLAAEGKLCVVVLSTELNPELINEGIARDVVRLIQNRRKDMELEFTDRIEVGMVTDSVELRNAIEANLEYVKTETLAVDLRFAPIPGGEGIDLKVAKHALTLYVRRMDADS
jgi:isoleucyl-tRNA synthetase